MISAFLPMYERAIAILDEMGLAHPAARVTAQLGILAWQQERNLEGALGPLEEAFALLAGDGERDSDVAVLSVQLGRMLYFSGRHAESFERTEFALEIAEALQLPDVLSHGLNTKSLLLAARGRRQRIPSRR